MHQELWNKPYTGRKQLYGLFEQVLLSCVYLFRIVFMLFGDCLLTQQSPPVNGKPHGRIGCVYMQSFPGCCLVSVCSD